MECTLDPTNKRTKMNLSVSTGEDIFSDNHMNIEPTSMTAVSNITLGETALTNMTCDVHSALKMMHIMDTGKSDSHPFQLMMTLSIPTINSAYVLRKDAGCMTGPNESLIFYQSRATPFFPHRLLLMVIFSVCFLSLLQPVTAMPHHALTLSVYALNANGFISTAKIHHINNVI